MVTNYTPDTCKYAYDRLDNVVFLVSKDAIGSISIDNGAAYVASASSAMSIACSNISLSEDESLDERYQFNHKLQFTVQGYMNVDDFDGKYYVILKDVNNTYWLMNPMFPCKVTYTYTIGAEENHTDFTFSTISNFPLLKVNDFTSNYTKPCNGYNLCGIDILAINERAYSSIEGDTVTYSNDGFKDVVFLKNSCIFTEQFDGTIVSHQVKFNISFDDYKSSWHYNLLEFADNKYAMVLQTKCGTNIACGFSHGLNPSFVVTANENEFNSIEITLSDLHDEGTFIKLPTHVPYNYTSATSWVWVEGEYECISDTTAKRLLMQEVDAFGNGLDRYMCLEGYRIDYEYLADKLVGEFTEIVTFPCDACRNTSCVLQTSMPQTIIFNGEGQEKTFTLYSPSEWSITSDSGITITPSSGTGGGNVDYITIKNNSVPTTTIESHTIVVNYCNKDEYFYADVVEASPTQCYPLGQYYNIDYNAQDVIIPTNCCILSVEANTVNLKEFQIQKGYVRMRADANDTGTGRTMTVFITDCTSATTEVYVYQSSFFSEWRTESTECDGRFMCDFQRLYSGVTQDAITARTYITRWNNCVDSDECKAKNYKWVEGNDTVCDNGKMWYLEYLNIYENGSWRQTGQVRYGREAEDVSGKCSTHIEHWLTVQNDYFCNDTTKYNKERLYYEEHYGDPQSAWTETDIYRMGTTVLESDSVDCGYGSGSGYTYQQWRPNGYECMSGSKYSKERKYVSNDTVNWVATDIYKIGILVEQFSEECGWTPNYEYRWVLVDEYQCGSGDSQYNLYQMYSQERRPIGSLSELEWEPVVPTVLSYDANGTEDPVMIESGSSECGSYTPPYEPIYRWVELPNTNVDYYCSGTTKFHKEKRQISIDNGETWSDMSPVEYRMGDPIEYDSVECGGGSGNEPQYRWVTITPSSDPSSYICDECQEEPQHRTVSGAPYCDGVDKYIEVDEQVSYDSGSTWTTTASTDVLVEANSYDCGYRERTTSGTPYCTGYDKYQDVYYEYSTDSGSTWITASTVPTLIEPLSEDCGYVPPFDGKFKITFRDGTSCSIPSCEGYGSVLTKEQWRTCKKSPSVNLIIGSCVTSIDIDCLTNAGSLTSVTINEGSMLTTIGRRAFEGCRSLPSLDLPSGLTTIEYEAFSGCASLASITIPDSVTNIGYWCFSYCSGLTNVTIGSGITNIDAGVFNQCRSLTSVTIPSGVTSIGRSAFYACVSLQSITCLATTPPALGSEAFYATNDCPIYVPCESLNSYLIADGWHDYSSRIYGIPPCGQPTTSKWLATYTGGTTSSAECDSSSAITSGEITTTELVDIKIGDCVRTIESDIFSQCTSLTSVTIGSGVASIGTYAFNNCANLTSITIKALAPPTLPNTTTLSNTNECQIYVPCESVLIYKTGTYWSKYASRIKGIPPCVEPTFNGSILLFYNQPKQYPQGTYSYSGGCSGGNWLTSGSTRPERYTYTAITEAIVGECITEIDTYAFDGCTNLRSIHLPSSITKIGLYAFRNCTGLTSIDIPNVTNIRDYAFQNCSGITNLDIPSGLTSIGKEAFSKCYGITNANIPSGVTTISQYAFADCSGLTSVTIPNSVTSIEWGALMGCKSLTSVTIPSGVTRIGQSAFVGCVSLQSITCLPITPPTYGYRPFDNTNDCPIYVPAESVEAYKSAWGSSLSSRIQAIP